MGWDTMRATDRTMFVIPSFNRGERERGGEGKGEGEKKIKKGEW